MKVDGDAIESQAMEGAERILRECLGLDRGDVLALFWDEMDRRAGTTDR